MKVSTTSDYCCHIVPKFTVINTMYSGKCDGMCASVLKVNR